jgi:hypothetical protein
MVEDIRLTVSDCPILRCPLCEYRTLPDAAMAELDHAAKMAREDRENSVTLKCPNESRRFHFSEEVGFLYDARDYLYIPGLWRPSSSGFLTPLFYNRRVLLKYSNAAGYALDLGSNTYGTVRMPAHTISFGLNRQDQIIMWLGDVDHLPIDEKHYLRSENIPSSHDVASEFYNGQIDVIWSEPSRERVLFDSRAEFVRKAQSLLGIPVMRLDSECAAILEGFRAPLNEDRRSIPNAIEDLCKVCVESINRRAFVKALENQGIAADPRLGGLKVLEKWLETRVGGTAPSIMSALFVLYDLRVNAAHLLSSEASAEALESARARLGGSAVDVSELYRLLVDQLGICFQQLARSAE